MKGREWEGRGGDTYLYQRGQQTGPCQARYPHVAECSLETVTDLSICH